MAIKIKNHAHHNCYKEIVDGYVGVHDGVNYASKQPVGLITRCSCGTLWKTKKYLISFSQWVKAGPWLRYKYRNDGWEGVNYEGY